MIIEFFTLMKQQFMGLEPAFRELEQILADVKPSGSHEAHIQSLDNGCITAGIVGNNKIVQRRVFSKEASDAISQSAKGDTFYAIFYTLGSYTILRFSDRDMSNIAAFSQRAEIEIARRITSLFDGFGGFSYNEGTITDTFIGHEAESRDLDYVKVRWDSSWRYNGSGHIEQPEKIGTESLFGPGIIMNSMLLAGLKPEIKCEKIEYKYGPRGLRMFLYECCRRIRYETCAFGSYILSRIIYLGTDERKIWTSPTILPKHIEALIVFGANPSQIAAAKRLLFPSKGDN